MAARATHPARPDSQPAFRLGTAAKPFGWATAVGDLNTDGTPDVVVVDRMSRRTNGNAYRIQFAVSGVGSRDVAFDSEHDALTVRIADVDHDYDLDVVVSGVLSHEIAGIWLNESGGQFQAAAVRESSAEIVPLLFVTAPDPPVDLSIAGLVPRRAVDSLPVLCSAPTATPALSRHPLRRIRPNRLQPVLRSAGNSPRAPPFGRS